LLFLSVTSGQYYNQYIFITLLNMIEKFKSFILRSRVPVNAPFLTAEQIGAKKSPSINLMGFCLFVEHTYVISTNR